MKWILMPVLSMMLVVTGKSWASPAGVVPYACRDGMPYVLLAFDPIPGRWAHGFFAGRKEPGESIAETAAREMREETRCAFDTPTAAELERKTPSFLRGLYTYVAEVPYRTGSSIAREPCAAILERFDWLWVRLPDLIVALDSGEESPEVPVAFSDRRITLWSAAADSMRQAARDGLLPNSLCTDKSGN